MDWIGPDLDSIWSGPDISWIGPDLKLAPCGPDDADGDVRGGGDEDGDDDDDDYGEDKYYDGDGAIIGLDLAEIGSDQNYKMEIRVAQSSVGSGFARVRYGCVGSYACFPNKKNLVLIESWQPRLQPRHMHRRTIPWAQQNVFIEVGRTGYWSVARRLPERLRGRRPTMAPIIPPRSGA